MAKWLNNDGLLVKFGLDEADQPKGGNLSPELDTYVSEFTIAAADTAFTSAKILGEASTATDGSNGVYIPKGATILEVQTLTTATFTSTGTINSAEFELGLVKAVDRTTELDYDGLLTTAFVGTAFKTLGMQNKITTGSTGAGALLGTKLTDTGVITVMNTGNGTNPLAAGSIRVRVLYTFI